MQNSTLTVLNMNAMGSRNYDPISESLKDIVKETYVIGDAVRARRALNATAEALDVALSI